MSVFDNWNWISKIELGSKIQTEGGKCPPVPHASNGPEFSDNMWEKTINNVQ